MGVTKARGADCSLGNYTRPRPPHLVFRHLLPNSLDGDTGQVYLLRLVESADSGCRRISVHASLSERLLCLRRVA